MSMRSYAKFAWLDACSLSQLHTELFNAGDSLRLFMQLDFDTLRQYEAKHHVEIATLISKTEGQRPAFLRRIQKNNPEKRHAELILLLAIIAQKRTHEVLNLRDRHGYAMGPGDGNRTTCTAWFEFSWRVNALVETYRFPEDVFNAYPSKNLDWGDAGN